MKKIAVTLLFAVGLLAGLILNGCGSTDTAERGSSMETNISMASETISLALPEENTTTTATPEYPDNISELAESSVSPAENAKDTTVIQNGPYGQISLSIPEDWNYETFPIDSGQTSMGLYGIHFYPEGVGEGYVELTYADWFGVCGTGLSETQAHIAGHPASIGTYDNHMYWDFISFEDDYKGIVALTYDVDNWWETYSGQVMEILDTLSFDTATREGGAFIYSAESECSTIGLSFSLKNISPTGATLAFRCYDTDAPTGELEYGDDFVLEILNNNAWEEVPVTLEGNYAFHQVAYRISSDDTSEQVLDWEWLYGTLAPGTYRIRKDIMDFRGSGDYDKHTVYAQFILN